MVNEPLGGAHRDPDAMMANLRKAIAESLRELQDQAIDLLLERRIDRIMGYGRFKELED